MTRRNWLSSALLLFSIVAIAGALALWKHRSLAETDAASLNPPESVEAVTLAVATKRAHRETSTSIGTVLALRSITLRNEVPGTVRDVALHPGAIVEAGEVLVALDVSVEEAELAALTANAALAAANLQRMQLLVDNRAVPVAELERAVAERDVAVAQIERIKATIARKTIRAPFRARVGLADVHPGQYLDTGTTLTTLQGIDDAAHVDFDVAQHVARDLHPGDQVEVIVQTAGKTVPARILAVDARINPATRNATVRALVEQTAVTLTPGSSVRVSADHGEARNAVVVPASALRRGPAGDHVFVIQDDAEGHPRVHVRKVQSGPSTGDEVLVLSGLAEGERVAASGSFKLREAAPVAIIDRAALALHSNP